MKFSNRGKWIATILITTLAAFLGVPEIVYLRTARACRIGTSAKQVVSALHSSKLLARTGVVLPPDSPDDTKERAVYFVMRLPSRFSILYFNYYERVISVRRDTPLEGLHRFVFAWEGE